MTSSLRKAEINLKMVLFEIFLIVIVQGFLFKFLILLLLLSARYSPRFLLINFRTFQVYEIELELKQKYHL